jgi:hypothetical protein
MLVLGYFFVHWKYLARCVNLRLLNEVPVHWQSQGLGESVRPIALLSNFVDEPKSSNNSHDPKHQCVVRTRGCRKLRDRGGSMDKVEDA